MKSILSLKMYLLIILLAVMGWTSVSYADPAPSVLFHWVSARGLQRWSDSIDQNGGVFQLKPFSTSIFIGAYPGFQGRRGVFTWIDVAGGTGSFSNATREWYAMKDKRTGEPARLLAIFLKPNLQSVTLNTYIDRTNLIPEFASLDSKGHLPETLSAGLILHQIFDAKTNKVILREYILLKRGFVSGIAADPSVTGPYLDAAYLRLQDPRPYPDSALHSLEDSGTIGLNSPYIRKVVLDIIDNARRIPSSSIPEFFRKNGYIPPAP